MCTTVCVPPNMCFKISAVLPEQHMYNLCVMHCGSSNGTQCLLGPGSACSVSTSRILLLAAALPCTALHRHSDLFSFCFYFFLHGSAALAPKLPKPAWSPRWPRSRNAHGSWNPQIGARLVSTSAETAPVHLFLASAYLASVTSACTASPCTL